MKNALIATNGVYTSDTAKTAHGLVRGTTRYKITGIIDHVFNGNDAGTLLDGQKRNIPIYKTLADALAGSQNIEYLIIGVATKGGVLPGDMRGLIKSAIENRISIVNGLHACLCDDDEISSLAKKHAVALIDIRKPKPFSELHFWDGSIKSVLCPIIAVLGIDCKMGKRTTAKVFNDACNQAAIISEMVYTGQTGYLQGFKFGFIFDSTVNDFISGELEKAVVACYTQVKPEVIFIEGQSALRNPNGPCGSEFILSANAKYVILQYSTKRKYFDNNPALNYNVPSLSSEVDLIHAFGAKVIAVSIRDGVTNDGVEAKELAEFKARYNIPLIDPLNSNDQSLIQIIKKVLQEHEN